MKTTESHLFLNRADSLRNAEPGLSVPNWLTWLFYGYVFLSFFEIYLPVVGEMTKYYLLVMILAFVMVGYRVMRFNVFSVCIGAWLAFKIVSLLWSDGSNYELVNTHLLSQLGMSLFFVVMTSIRFETEFLTRVVNAFLYFSLAFGLLSLLFPGSYIDERYEARQVLTLFGSQNDPNNCAVFLLIGICIAGYYCIVQRRRFLVSIITIFVNLVALVMASSRAGFLCLVVVAIVLVVFGSTKKHDVMGIVFRLLLGTALVIAGCALLMAFAPSASLDRLLDFSDYEGGSGRSDRWQSALPYFLASPLIGAGWGGYNIGGVVHNTFLTSLCDGGLIETFFLVFPFCYIAWQAIKNRNPLILLLVIAAVLPALFIDAINKRFFWDLLAVTAMFVVSGCPQLSRLRSKIVNKPINKVVSNPREMNYSGCSQRAVRKAGRKSQSFSKLNY